MMSPVRRDNARARGRGCAAQREKMQSLPTLRERKGQRKRLVGHCLECKSVIRDRPPPGAPAVR